MIPGSSTHRQVSTLVDTHCPVPTKVGCYQSRARARLYT